MKVTLKERRTILDKGIKAINNLIREGKMGKIIVIHVYEEEMDSAKKKEFDHRNRMLNNNKEISDLFGTEEENDLARLLGTNEQKYVQKQGYI